MLFLFLGWALTLAVFLDRDEVRVELEDDDSLSQSRTPSSFLLGHAFASRMRCLSEGSMVKMRGKWCRETRLQRANASAGDLRGITIRDVWILSPSFLVF